MPKKLRKCITERGERERAKRQKQKNAIRAAERRKNETPEQYRHRLSKVAQNTRKRRNAETEEQANQRRLKDSIRQAERRKNETPEQNRNHLSTVAQNTAAKKRKNDTEEEQDERNIADQTAKRIKRDI